MLFNSIHFLFFFPVVVMLYFAIPSRLRWILLLAASAYFYMCWKPEYIFVILFSVTIDYFAAIEINRSKNQLYRKAWLVGSLVSTLLILLFFKYFNFFNDSFRELFNHYNIFYGIPAYNIILPVGISFHTFQTMAYTIDVYRKRILPEKHYGFYALYVLFFPQMVAGPIERGASMLPQLRKKNTFSYSQALSGLRLMLWGFFKKIVIADNLSLVANQVYNNPAEQNSLTYIIGTIFFAFQIYCDFSGYSDIARGSARIMGYNLMQNFNVPYIARSIKEFWSRWHISLSTWFRDYVYITLGGNRVIKWRSYFNLFITFLISGLWHGANWTFVIWGALHGFYIIVEKTFEKQFKKQVPRFIVPLQIAFVFILVLLAWVFFRADSTQQATHIINLVITQSVPDIQQYFSGANMFKGLGKYSISYILLLSISILLFYTIDWLKEQPKLISIFNKNAYFRMGIYFVLLYSIIFFGYFGEVEFIYFQF